MRIDWFCAPLQSVVAAQGCLHPLSLSDLQPGVQVFIFLSEFSCIPRPLCCLAMAHGLYGKTLNHIINGAFVRLLDLLGLDGFFHSARRCLGRSGFSPNRTPYEDPRRNKRSKLVKLIRNCMLRNCGLHRSYIYPVPNHAN